MSSSFYPFKPISLESSEITVFMTNVAQNLDTMSKLNNGEKLEFYIELVLLTFSRSLIKALVIIM
jgi:hypothetical protein